jgi:hypothetical protein
MGLPRFWDVVAANKAAWLSVLGAKPLGATCQLAIVVGTRNDQWGGAGAPLHRRAARALGAALASADEVELVDMNSPAAPMLSLLPAVIAQHTRLRSMRVTAQQCAELLGVPSCGCVHAPTVLLCALIWLDVT